MRYIWLIPLLPGIGAAINGLVGIRSFSRRTSGLVACTMMTAALFMIGVIGVLVRRNIIIIFMSIELILNAVNINLIAYSAQLQNVIGQVFAVFVIAVAAAEAAVGLGIILAFYRNKETVNIDEMNLMRW